MTDKSNKDNEVIFNRVKKALITPVRFATGQAGITGPRYAPS